MEWLIGNYLIKPSYFSPNELSKLYAWKIRLGVSELLNVTQLLHLLIIWPVTRERVQNRT